MIRAIALVQVRWNRCRQNTESREIFSPGRRLVLIARIINGKTRFNRRKVKSRNAQFPTTWCRFLFHATTSASLSSVVHCCSSSAAAAAAGPPGVGSSRHPPCEPRCSARRRSTVRCRRNLCQRIPTGAAQNTEISWPTQTDRTRHAAARRSAGGDRLHCILSRIDPKNAMGVAPA